MTEEIDFMGPPDPCAQELYEIRTELAQSRFETMEARREVRQLLALLKEMQEEREKEKQTRD